MQWFRNWAARQDILLWSPAPAGRRVPPTCGALSLQPIPFFPGDHVRPGPAVCSLPHHPTPYLCPSHRKRAVPVSDPGHKTGLAQGPVDKSTGWGAPGKAQCWGSGELMQQESEYFSSNMNVGDTDENPAPQLPGPGQYPVIPEHTGYSQRTRLLGRI